MIHHTHYQHDTEFTKLLARRSDVDLTLAALELARDLYPGLDFRPTFDWINARGAELAGPVARARNERESLSELGRCLAEIHGIHGSPEAYEQADGSCLNRVIETGNGLPITLSILYMAVASQVGIELQGVSAPLHFLTRYESAEGPLFVDAFGDGRVLDEQECVEWLRAIADDETTDMERALQPALPRTIILRMLNNLKAIHARQENWRAAWRVQHRLSALHPASYEERRDLAVISLWADRPGQAIDLLRSCLRNCAPTERDALNSHLADAEKQLVRWN